MAADGLLDGAWGVGWKSWVSLMRPGNSPIMGFASIVGYVVGGGSNSSIIPLLFVSSYLIGSYDNIINDRYDVLWA